MMYAYFGLILALQTQPNTGVVSVDRAIWLDYARAEPMFMTMGTITLGADEPWPIRGSEAPSYPPDTLVGRCPICAATKPPTRSDVRMARGWVGTCLAWVCNDNEFWDSDGRYHVHERCHTCGRPTASFTCSNGHAWTIEAAPDSCWCGWREGAKR